MKKVVWLLIILFVLSGIDIQIFLLSSFSQVEHAYLKVSIYADIYEEWSNSTSIHNYLLSISAELKNDTFAISISLGRNNVQNITLKKFRYNYYVKCNDTYFIDNAYYLMKHMYMSLFIEPSYRVSGIIRAQNASIHINDFVPGKVSYFGTIINDTMGYSFFRVFEQHKPFILLVYAKDKIYFDNGVTATIRFILREFIIDSELPEDFCDLLYDMPVSKYKELLGEKRQIDIMIGSFFLWVFVVVLSIVVVLVFEDEKNINTKVHLSMKSTQIEKPRWRFLSFSFFRLLYGDVSGML